MLVYLFFYHHFCGSLLSSQNIPLKFLACKYLLLSILCSVSTYLAGLQPLSQVSRLCYDIPCTVDITILKYTALHCAIKGNVQRNTFSLLHWYSALWSHIPMIMFLKTLCSFSMCWLSQDIPCCQHILSHMLIYLDVCCYFPVGFSIITPTTAHI